MTSDPTPETDAKPAGEPPAPAHPLSFDAIARRVIEQFPACRVEDLGEKGGGDPHLLAPVAQVWEVCDFLRNDDELFCDSLMSQAGVDDGEKLHVVYCLHAMPRTVHGERRGGHRLLLKTSVERGSPPEDPPHVPTVESLWRVANFFEREIYDLFGIVFDNHPDLRRIMNPEDWVGHPGRRDYVYPAYYGVDNQGNPIPTEREGQFTDNYTVEDKIAGLPTTKDAKDGPRREWDLIREGKLTKEAAASRAAMGEIRTYHAAKRGPADDEPPQLGEGVAAKQEEKKSAKGNR